MASARFLTRILVVVLLLGGASLLAQNAPLGREARWRADLDVLAAEFPAKQLDFAKLYPNGLFAREMDAIKGRLQGSSDADIVLDLMRLVASANVAHTALRWPQNQLAFRRLPLGVAWYSDGLAVTSAADAYRAALGMRVTKIGALTPEALEKAIAPYVAHENDVWLHQQSPTFMMTVELLRRAGQLGADDGVTLGLARPDGTTFEMRVTAPAPPPPMLSATEVLKIPTALFRKQPNSYYWYEVLPDSKTLYVQYNRCQDDPKQPFSEFTKAMFADVDARSIDRVVVDLRFNSGGDSRVIAPLLQGLRARQVLSARGRLYALIGRATFSSGLIAAVNFRDDLRAVLIGEPLGEKPNSYGEIRELVLPNSQLVVQYSTKFFRLVKDGDPSSFMPDVLVTRTIADALAGRDPVLERALTHVVR